MLLLAGAMLLSACAPSGDATQPTPTPTPGYRDSVLADHPVAFWPMDETSGTAMADASGNHNDGTYVGAVGLGQPGPFKAAANAAVALNGAWATAPSSASLRLDTISIELWIDMRSQVEFGAYLTKNFAPGGDLGTGWFQLLNSHHDGHLEFRVTSDLPTLVSNQSLSLSRWYYVVATYDGSTARVYINGKLDGSIAVSAVPKQTADPIEIGRRSDGLVNDVLISSVAIYPTALSADRVAEHWRAAASSG